MFGISEKEKLEKRLGELQDIPLLDVHGGRQRTSKENEEIYRIKSKLTNL
jgi:hypothetical protein